MFHSAEMRSLQSWKKGWFSTLLQCNSGKPIHCVQSGFNTIFSPLIAIHVMMWATKNSVTTGIIIHTLVINSFCHHLLDITRLQDNIDTFGTFLPVLLSFPLMLERIWRKKTTQLQNIHILNPGPVSTGDLMYLSDFFPRTAHLIHACNYFISSRQFDPDWLKIGKTVN